MTTMQGLTKRCKAPAKLPSFNTCITLLQKYEKTPATHNLPSTTLPRVVQQRLKAVALNTTDNKMTTKLRIGNKFVVDGITYTYLKCHKSVEGKEYEFFLEWEEDNVKDIITCCYNKEQLS